MRATWPTSLPWWPAVRRELLTPKGRLLLILSGLSLIALPTVGWVALAPLSAALLVAGLLDLVLLRLRRGHWLFPSGALLSGLIVALILDPREPVLVVALTVALAIVSKYLLPGGTANLFNPAALALVVNALVAGSNQSWWGSLAGLPWFGLLLLLAIALYVADHVNRLPAMLSFSGGYVLIATLVALLGDASRVVELFRLPGLNAALFFAGVMLTDPPTVPNDYADQFWCGLLVAGGSALIFLTLGTVYYLPAGLLLGNLWTAGRRWQRRRHRAA